jgi:hypothetical protein
MSDSAVSSTELIAAGHAVATPHDAGEKRQSRTSRGQALCGMTGVTGH